MLKDGVVSPGQIVSTTPLLHNFPVYPAPQYYPPSYNPPDVPSFSSEWDATKPPYLHHYDLNNRYKNNIPPTRYMPYSYPVSLPEASISPNDVQRGGKRDRCDIFPGGRAVVDDKPYHQEKLKSSKISFQSTKSVRRRRKLYSDFVGVTYNKTHAKYQACITHYRKQHYLGRYKLAVDAALAYDESARLLKGSSWKVNFRTKGDYEEAKLKELQSIKETSARNVDVAVPLVSVVDEIGAHSGCQSRAFESALLSTASTSHVPPSLSDGNALVVLSVNKISSEDSPLPESPNNTRHRTGMMKSTPEGVIRPKNLGHHHQQGKDCQKKESMIGTSPLPLHRIQSDFMTLNQQEEISFLRKPISEDPLPVDSELIIPLNAISSKHKKTVPPVIQNGTLAAASALMTLFGKEKIPTG